MLKGAAGIIVIPKDFHIDEHEAKHGKLLVFDVVSYEPRKGLAPQGHRLRLNMYCKQDEISEWKEKIQAGQHFLATCIEIASWFPEGSKFPLPILRVRPWNLSVLKKPVIQE